PPRSTPFPYPTLFRSEAGREHTMRRVLTPRAGAGQVNARARRALSPGRIRYVTAKRGPLRAVENAVTALARRRAPSASRSGGSRSEEHTSELQSLTNL